ncbi:hypothetical protein [Ancylobacter defluvii]|uniref:Uncharacterized protein n=1 Tax=Ancylobacter defluvii TaxID=1282440 RepID=A0A9W6K1V0_9HYPH|nr:hypothetical protein [Ancylobacter defluvii]GLK86165.1 hypothetical protein GCM10017653_42350 [Ancylobacter defluvii]
MIETMSLILIAVLAVPLIALAAVLLYLLLIGVGGVWWALKGND